MESIGTLLIQLVAVLFGVAVVFALFGIVRDLFSREPKFPNVTRSFRMKIRKAPPLIYGRGDRQIRPEKDEG